MSVQQKLYKNWPEILADETMTVFDRLRFIFTVDPTELQLLERGYPHFFATTACPAVWPLPIVKLVDMMWGEASFIISLQGVDLFKDSPVEDFYRLCMQMRVTYFCGPEVDPQFYRNEGAERIDVSDDQLHELADSEYDDTIPFGGRDFWPLRVEDGEVIVAIEWTQLGRINELPDGSSRL